MSAPPKKLSLQERLAKVKKQQKNSAAAAAKSAAGARKPVPRQAESSDEGSSSDDEESDSEIGLTADENQRATMKPITGDAKKAAPAPAPTKGKGKKRKAAAAASDDDDEDDNADPNELIDVEFGIYDPKPADYLTLKQLLKDYIVPTTAAAAAKKAKKNSAAAGEDTTAAASAAPIDDFALHELCDAVVEQAAVGSMVKGEGTEEPLGFLTAVSLAWQEKNGKNQDGGRVKWVSQFKEYIVKHAPPAQKATFEAALSAASTGLLLQGRLINVPPQIVPQLHSCLLEDMVWARANTGEYGKSFQFKQYVMIARTFKPAAGTKKAVRHDVVQATQFISPFASKKKQKKDAAAAAKAAVAEAANADASEYEWLRFEEELYARSATTQYTFACPFTAEDAAAGRQPQNCVVLLVPHNKLANIAMELQAMAAVI